MRKISRSFPTLRDRTAGVGAGLMQQFISTTRKLPAEQIALGMHIQELREDLGFSASSTLEDLAIDDLVMSSMLYQYAQHIQLKVHGLGVSDETYRSLEQRMTTRQTRFHRSIDMLTLLRHMASHIKTGIREAGDDEAAINTLTGTVSLLLEG